MPDAGIIVDIEVVTGEESDFARMFERLDALEVTLGRRPGTVTADRAYGIGKVYAALADRDISAVIPPRPSTRQARAKGFPVERFRYDATHDIARCPRRKVMTPRSATKTGRWFRADATACRTCPLRARCIPDGGASRRVHITKTHVATLRARRKRLAWRNHETNLTSRHRWLVEGVHGLAKTLHGMARAARRGLENMKIQAFLTATAINLKRLAKATMLALLHALLNARNEQNTAAVRQIRMTLSTAPGGQFPDPPHPMRSSSSTAPDGTVPRVSSCPTTSRCCRCRPMHPN